jgi:hypothetical protein
MGATTLYPVEHQLLFTRANLEQIAERFATYILQRGMEVNAAWHQAIEDEAELIDYKLELMEEGALEWDDSSEQLAAMRKALSQQLHPV